VLRRSNVSLRWVVVWSLGVVVCGSMLDAAEAGEARPSLLTLSLERAIEIALERAYAVREALVDLEGAEEARAGEGIWVPFNPELSGAVGRRSSPLGEETDFDVSVSQTLGLPGQRGRRLAVAGAQVASRRAELRHARLEVTFEVKAAFARALLAQRNLELAGEAASVTAELYRSVRERKSAGVATDLQLNMAAIEQARARQSVILDARRLRAARGELGRLLGLPLETAGLEGELAPPPPVASTLATLTERALAKRPDIEALEARAQRGEAQIRLAHSEAWPKPTLSAGYAREDGSDRIASVGLSLPLPLFNRNQVRVAEAQAEARRQWLALERQRLQVEREVVLAFEADRSALEVVGLFAEEILARAADNLGLLQASYEAGKIGFIPLLLVQRDLLQARREHTQSVAEALRARAALELAVGGEAP
jgi:cobalt-zinc-cadmium efflux system outer membrane protein